MCGLSAIIHLDHRPATVEPLHGMNAAVSHRGPDGSGVLCESSVGLAHTRLSIIDVEERANQPMSRERAHLVFNGEIYNYLELRSELEAKGRRFKTTSDTEVLLVALREWGRGALDRLCGMFAFVYYDVELGQVWAVRDRFGIKPLVTSRVANTVLFASEAKQILKTGMIDPVLNRNAAAAFLGRAQLSTGKDTFFAGIEEIRAGEMAVVDLAKGTVDVTPWYKLAEKVVLRRPSYNEAREGLRALLEQSIRRHHRSDVPLAASLSGGIDSSVVVTLSRTQFPDKDLTTISTFSRHQGYDETRFSRAVAEANNVNAIEIEVDASRVWDPDLHEELGYYQDQPIKGGSQYNEYLLFKAARENGFTVMLDGQGADEYFGGYGQFWFSAQYELLTSGRLKPFLEGLKANSETMNRSFLVEMRSFVRGLASGLHRRFQPLQGAARWVREPWLDVTSQGTERFLSLSLEQLGSTSVPFQLYSQDRAAMRWSIESRVPFLDHEVVEFVLGLPTEYKVGQGYRKRILRDSIPEIPFVVSNRKDKIGFASPDNIALRGQSDYVRSMLEHACANLKDLVDEEVMIRDFDTMAAGKSMYDPAFFRVLAFDGWRRAHNVSI
ncbi:asparagine synthase (glutamine-hydrolyzing) [Mameliella sp. CS4]|uniref:asparagine synthase (glutamine-hydrolyzing) n=1 Tax=Mameliella sp. CS4 TaxID=2862329 RepID=UPI001C60540B|nr:asparagine synthase (glutamine-hydrolyzing) [Mameliella sp. CS4]MBW4985697.1 asparagine synthase (glutamine-hydrolyzing) [Mameliella sp. CS4]